MLKILLLSLLMLLGVAASACPALERNVGRPARFPDSLRNHDGGEKFIMVCGGRYDFDIDKQRPGTYAYDYWVAMTAAALPWIFCTLYCVFFMASTDSRSGQWMPMMLLSRFAAPTSAGVLFSMLTAAGLGTTWVFRQARILAIFDDIDTILLVVLTADDHGGSSRAGN